MNLSRVFVSFVALSGLAIVSGCQTETELPESNHQKVVFHAGWDPETRTELQDDGSIFWSPEDEISVFCVVDNGNSWSITGRSRFVSTNTENVAKTTFVGEIEPTDNATYYAVYPYSSDNNVSYHSIRVIIPTVQTAVADSYDRTAFVSYAETKSDTFYFKNLCGGIKFSVSQEGIKEVSFKYTSGDIMSGDLFIDVVAENAPILRTWGTTRSNEVIIRAPDNSYFEVGKYYYAVMYPSTNQSPLMVTFKKDDSRAIYTTEGTTAIKRSVFKRLLNKDFGLRFEKKKDSDGAIMMSSYMGDDKVSVTEVYFHPSSDHVTDINFGTEEGPVYYERIGSVVHYYTPKESFNLKNVTSHMFVNWDSLTKIDFSGVDTSEATDFSCFFGWCWNLKDIDLTGFDTSQAIDMSSMFAGCKSLAKLDLSSFDVTHVTKMSAMFEGCRNLRELDLSSFETGRCTDMSFMFNYCVSLEKLDMKSFNVSSVNSFNLMCHNFAIHRKHCIVRASEETRELMCEENANMPESSKQYFITWISPSDDFPEIIDPFADLYKSTDYSKDKTFRTLQTATQGKGLDIVIMGDAYSDRLIENGKYDSDLSGAIEHIFSEEPLKSLRDYFNVYISYAVSENESITGITAFDLVFEDWPSTLISGGDGVTDDYVRAILPDYGREWMTGRPTPFIIIVANSIRHAGTNYFFTSGSTLTLSALGLDDTDYHAIICHEFGHALGRLADEYDDWSGHLTFGDIPSEFDNYIQSCSEGFWPNVDITNDPDLVKWSHFLSDERYSNQGLGIFEGGFAQYAYGIWRPTENSIMNSATTGFNAPCREAVYKRVNELANDSFVYDYETFVAFDQKAMSRASKPNSVRMDYRNSVRKLPPPVFIKGTDNPNGASTTIKH